MLHHPIPHLCKACRSAAVKFCPETVRGSCHGKCREISGEILLFLFPQETKLESAWNFSRQISRHFSPDASQLQMPNFVAFFILQTFVFDIPPPPKKDPVAPILPPSVTALQEKFLAKTDRATRGVAATLTPIVLHCATEDLTASTI